MTNRRAHCNIKKMKLKIELAVSLSLLLLPALSFASREDAINQALTRIETARVSANVQQNEYIAEGNKSQQHNLPPFDTQKSEAREEAIKAAFYIVAAYDANHIHYSEWDSGDKLDEDFGTHRGYYIAAGYRSPNYYEWVMGRPFIEGYFRRFSNIIRYKGAVQYSSGGTIYTTPFDADQRSVVNQYGLKVGAQRDFLDKGNFLGYLDVGERIWHRAEDEIISGGVVINGVPVDVQSYGEKYYWTYIGFGAGMSYKITPKFSLGFEAEWMITLPNLRKLHANDTGYGDTTYKLGSVWGAEAKLPIKYYILKNLSLDITPYFTYWKIKQSNDVPLDDTGFYSYEPDSKTHLEGLLAGFTYSF